MRGVARPREALLSFYVEIYMGLGRPNADVAAVKWSSDFP